MRWMIRTTLLWTLLASAVGCDKTDREETSPTVLVHTYLGDTRVPASSGVVIEIDGRRAGTTAEDGTLLIRLDSRVTPSTEIDLSDQYRIRAIDGEAFVGEAILDTRTGVPTRVDVILDARGWLHDPGDLHIPQLVGGVLPKRTESLRLELRSHEDAMLALTQVSTLDLKDSQGQRWDLREQFRLTDDGGLEARDIEAILATLGDLFGECAFVIHGEEKDGGNFEESIPFWVGHFDVEGTLVAPPSSPWLNLEGIRITTRSLSTGDAYESIADEAGVFTLPNLPAGAVEFDVEIEQAHATYFGFGTLPISGDSRVSLTLLTLEDIRNGVPSLIVTEESRVGRRSGFDQMRARTPVSSPDSSILGDEELTLEVRGEIQGQRVFDTLDIEVPAGTDSVNLRYLVSTDEYPDYVSEQRLFSDLWELAIFADNPMTGRTERLFDAGRAIDSQLFESPRWQSDGSTGEVTVHLDVDEIARNGATLTLFAASTNVGDDFLPTTIQATASTAPPFRINEIRADSLPFVVPAAYRPPNDVDRYVSLPRFGATNVQHRWFRLELSRPHRATIDNVIVELFNEFGRTRLMEILNDGPGDHIREDAEDPQALFVRVTLGEGNPSTIARAPSADTIVYRFTLEGTHDGQPVRDMKEWCGRALWQMPMDRPRFGTRESGGDDWCSRETHAWIQENGVLLTALDDVGREHNQAFSRPRSTATESLEIFPFVDLLSSKAPFNGAANYDRLRRAAESALEGTDDFAKEDLITWVGRNREGLTALASSKNVQRVRVGIGSPTEILLRGWARDLLESGRLLDRTGRELKLELPPWKENKVAFDRIHNTHIRIDLE